MSTSILVPRIFQRVNLLWTASTFSHPPSICRDIVRRWETVVLAGIAALVLLFVIRSMLNLIRRKRRIVRMRSSLEAV
jgi:hypothetical protein